MICIACVARLNLKKAQTGPKGCTGVLGDIQMWIVPYYCISEEEHPESIEMVRALSRSSVLLLSRDGAGSKRPPVHKV